MSWLTAGIGAYILAQLAIGLWVSRRVRSEDDYLLAGRQLGPVVATFTVFATWFGAETCLGAAGQAYAFGLPGNSADPFGYAIALILVGALLAVPLHRRGITTLADLFRDRFSPRIEQLAVLLMVPTSVLWAAAQVRAFGQILDAASGWGVDVTVTVAAAVVVVYTAVGGLLADAYTDLVQGVVLIAGLIALFCVALLSGDLGGALSALPPERLALAAPDTGPLDVVETWAIPIVGSLVAQELIARVLAARSPAVARRAPIAAGVLYLAVGLIPVVIGLAAARLLPGLGEPEQVLVAAAEAYLPPLLYALFAGALVSAILSTVDSALLVAGSLVAHNLVIPRHPSLSERARVRVNRIAVAGFGVVAYVMALHADGVYALVEEASAFGTSGVFVCTMFALFSDRGGPRAAAAGLAVGLGVYAGGSYLVPIDQPYLTSLLASALAYVTVAAREPGRPS